MGRHTQDGNPKPQDNQERKFPLSYTDIAEGIGAVGLSVIVVSEVVDSGPTNLAIFTAAAMLAYDIARRHDTGRRGPPA